MDNTDFTDPHWEPILPGDTFRPKIAKQFQGEISELLWPSLAHQLFPRDAENLNLRTARIGDRIYASIFIDLFPKELQAFSTLFNRVMAAHIHKFMAYCL